MQENTIIQQNLFAINNDPKHTNSSNEIPEDLSNAILKEESQKRPRQRKNSTNLISEFKNDSSTERKTEYINEKSYSYKSVDKQKLTPVLKHYVQLKEENNNRFLLYRLGDFFECFFEDAVSISNLLEITLTSKDAGKEIGKIPMAGVPHHAMER